MAGRGGGVQIGGGQGYQGRNQKVLEQQGESGFLPCSNCCITVEQDRFVAKESCGKFTGLVEPGLSFNGFDICGCCVTYRSISKRIEETSHGVPAKLADHQYVTVWVKCQAQVDPEGLDKALYSLSDTHGQLSAAIADAVQTYASTRAFSEQAIHQVVQQAMQPFGILVPKIMVSYSPDKENIAAMNEVKRQERLKEAAVNEAEAAKNQAIKAAEGNMEQLRLQGEGIARQRTEIVSGIREKLGAGGDAPSPDQITQLLLITQWFDTLKSAAHGGKSNTTFLRADLSGLQEVAQDIRYVAMQQSSVNPTPRQMQMA